MAFRFTSPALKEEDRLLRECPTGLVMRKTPYIYHAINAHNYAESGALNPLDSPPWAQQAFMVIGSEKGRLLRIKNEQQLSRGQSKSGLRYRQSQRARK